MRSEDRECIWMERCGDECSQDCRDYTPVDDIEDSENFYSNVLRENVEVYQREIDEYSDGRSMEYESCATAKLDAKG